MSFIHLVGGRMEKKNKEVGFHAQIHSSRVNKHVNDIRLTVDSKHVSRKHSKIFTQLLSHSRANVIVRRKGSRGDETSWNVKNFYLHTATFRSCRRHAHRCESQRHTQFYKFDNDDLTVMQPVLVNDMF